MQHDLSYLYWAASLISSDFQASQDLFPSQTQLSLLPPGVGMEPGFPFFPVNLLGVLSPPLQGPGAEWVWGRQVPHPRHSVPTPRHRSAGRRVDARATPSPGSKSLANKTITFPCSNLFGHCWEFQRNKRTSVTQPSPTCLNSSCYSVTGVAWNRLSLHCCHQVASRSNPSDSFIVSGPLCA